MIGLAGGTDVYGLKAADFADGAFFADVRANAPTGATAAIVRTSPGPTDGERYFLRDLLLVVNLTSSPLANPFLGVGPDGSTFQTNLLERGFARNPEFGGAGPVALSASPDWASTRRWFPAMSRAWS